MDSTVFLIVETCFSTRITSRSWSYHNTSSTIMHFKQKHGYRTEVKSTVAYNGFLKMDFLILRIAKKNSILRFVLKNT